MAAIPCEVMAMPWIRVIDEPEAEGPLKQIYDEIKRTRGKVANILKVHSLRPDALKAHLDFYLTLMFTPGGLRRLERELLATVVSVLNGCAYCTRHHAEALNFYWKDAERLQGLIEDYTQVELPERERAMVTYAAKLTRSPAEMSESDVQTLRQAGLSDEEILQVALIVGYFNFVNRVADGLGVEFSEDEVRGYKY
jgi:uncharacterized peroxidase-related enzyme